MTKTQRNKLKKLLRVAMLKKWGEKCLKCGKETSIATSHIYPKGTHRKMEFMLDNVKPLCYRHHIHWWHKSPVEAKEWLETVIPKKTLAKLSKLANSVISEPLDYEKIKNKLEKHVNNT